MPIPPKSNLVECRNFFARHAKRAPGQNQFWPAQPRAIPAKSGYVTGGTPVRPRISTRSFPTFFGMPIPPKLIPGQNGNFFARHAARAWAKSVLASPAQGHSGQIFVCHRGYPSLTQNFKPIFSGFFAHADSSQIVSRSKQKLFCAPRRARAWAISVLASPSQGQIWVCHRAYPSLTKNFKPIFSYSFQHADSSQIDSRSKQKLFCAPRRARAWAISALASPSKGQIWVCHRAYPSLTQNFKPIFAYGFQHADSSQIDSWSKQELFCAPRRARAWAISVLASPSQGQIWVCHRAYPSLTQNFKPIFAYGLQHADSTQIDSR